MNNYVLPIDLELLRAEKEGLAAPPVKRHASETVRNNAAANDKRTRFVDGNASEFPQTVASVENHMLSKGYTIGAVNEHMRDLAKHQSSLRCEVTGNLVGTDIWPEGHPCVCMACRR